MNDEILLPRLHVNYKTVLKMRIIYGETLISALVFFNYDYT